MAIFLKSQSLKEDLEVVCDILKNNEILDNIIYDTCEIWFSDKTDEELLACEYDLAVFEQYEK